MGAYHDVTRLANDEPKRPRKDSHSEFRIFLERLSIPEERNGFLQPNRQLMKTSYPDGRQACVASSLNSPHNGKDCTSTSLVIDQAQIKHPIIIECTGRHHESFANERLVIRHQPEKIATDEAIISLDHSRIRFIRPFQQSDKQGERIQPASQYSRYDSAEPGSTFQRIRDSRDLTWESEATARDIMPSVHTYDIHTFYVRTKEKTASRLRIRREVMERRQVVGCPGRDDGQRYTRTHDSVDDFIHRSISSDHDDCVE